MVESNVKPESKVAAAPNHAEQIACGVFYSQWYMEQHSKAQITQSSVPWQCRSVFEDENQAGVLKPKSAADWADFKRSMDEAIAGQKVGTHIEIDDLGPANKK